MNDLPSFEELAETGELMIWTFTDKAIIARIVRLDDPGMPHYKIEARPEACGRCFKDPAAGYATIGDIRFCHGDDDPSCYMLTQWESSWNTPYPTTPNP